MNNNHTFTRDENITLEVTGVTMFDHGRVGRENFNIRLELPGNRDEEGNPIDKTKIVTVRMLTLVDELNGVHNSLCIFPEYQRATYGLDATAVRRLVALETRNSSNPFDMIGKMVQCRIAEGNEWTDKNGDTQVSDIVYINTLSTEDMAEDDFLAFIDSTTIDSVNDADNEEVVF